MRLIDADALIKDIAKSIRLADEWEKESHEKKDKIGLKYAIDTRRSLLSMISRIKEAPTIDAEPVRHGHWIIRGGDMWCSECGYEDVTENGEPEDYHYCPHCGTKMDGGDSDA